MAAPPSLHPNGKQYAWLTEQVDLGQSLPSFDHSWVIESTPSVSRFVSNVSTTKLRNVAAYIRQIHAISGEGGHNATFRAACKLREAGLEYEDALALLVEWNETNAHPAWSAKELSHKIDSAYQGG